VSNAESRRQLRELKFKKWAGLFIVHNKYKRTKENKQNTLRWTCNTASQQADAYQMPTPPFSLQPSLPIRVK
jgi:hypothetical protein